MNYFVDVSEAEDSDDGIVSDTSLATSKMTMANLQRFLRKSNTLLEDSSKMLNEMRSQILEVYRSQPINNSPRRG